MNTIVGPRAVNIAKNGKLPQGTIECVRLILPKMGLTSWLISAYLRCAGSDVKELAICHSRFPSTTTSFSGTFYFYEVLPPHGLKWWSYLQTSY